MVTHTRYAVFIRKGRRGGGTDDHQFHRDIRLGVAVPFCDPSALPPPNLAPLSVP